MSKNPFSVYDFLGYAIPGALTLYILKYIQFSLVSEYVDVLFDVENKNTVFYILCFIVSSYVIGHLVNYLSSITVELFSIWCYGYPSDYLYKTPKAFRYFHRKTISRPSSYSIHKLKNNEPIRGKIKNNNRYKTLTKFIYCIPIICKLIARIILLLLLFPLAVGYLLLALIASISGFTIVKPMSRNNWSYLNLMWNHFVKCSNLSIDNLDKPQDNYRLITNYVYENFTIASRKLDNYVALYGFTRSMAFIFSSLFTYNLISWIFNNWDYEWYFDFSVLLSFQCIIGLTATIFYFAFIKFFRRYTHESFMNFITITVKKKYEHTNNRYTWLCRE